MSAQLSGRSRTDAGAAAPGDQSLVELVLGVVDDTRSLVRGEIELAKAEVQASARNAGKGAGFLGAAALLALTGWLLGNIAAALGIVAAGLPFWAGFLIITVLNLAVAALLAFLGKREMERVQGLSRTQASVARTQAALKGALPTGSG
jgi:hypothetical protein